MDKLYFYQSLKMIITQYNPSIPKLFKKTLIFTSYDTNDEKRVKTSAMDRDAAEIKNIPMSTSNSITTEPRPFSTTEMANTTMDYCYYVCSSLLLASSIAIEAGTGVDIENTIQIAQDINNFIWSYVDGLGTACIAETEENKRKIAQRFNALQLLTATTLVAANTIAAPFASVSFALAMGISAYTEGNHYQQKKVEAETAWDKFKESMNDDDKKNDFNRAQTQALEHKDARKAYLYCTVAMGLVAGVSACAATGGVAMLALICVSVSVSVIKRHISQKNKASNRHDIDHAAIKQLKEIQKKIQDEIQTNIQPAHCYSWTFNLLNSKPSITTHQEKNNLLNNIIEKTIHLIKNKKLKEDSINTLIQDIKNSHEEKTENTLINEEEKTKNTLINEIETDDKNTDINTLNLMIINYNKQSTQTNTVSVDSHQCTT